MAVAVIQQPAVEPLHLDEARAHLRVPSGQTGQDAAVRRMISAARRYVESFCSLALVRQQQLLTLDCFPAEIGLPVGPLRAVQSIQYVDTDGVTQTLAASAYRVDTYSERPRIEPAYGTVWPSTQDVVNAVLVKYTAGHVVPIASFDTSGDALTATGHDLAADTAVRLSNSGGVMQSGLSVDTQYYVKAPATDTLQLALTAGGAAVDITATTAATGNNFVGQIPDDIIAAMLLIIGHLYRNREENSDFEVFDMPLNAERMLWPHRLMRF